MKEEKAMKKICAVIVTYNRPELLCRCVEKLLAQDHPLDILIYDNHSTKDTKAMLSEKGLLNERVTFYYAESNTGGSGGFYNGMEMLVKKDYDALWLMDDDGYPISANTLSAIIDVWKRLGYENKCILNSLVVCDENTLKLSFSMDREFDGRKMRERAENGLLKDLNSPFNGTFVPVNLARKIGYPMKEFFVYGDETEYMLRAKSAGATIYTVVDSLYFHPTMVCKTKKFFGRELAVSNFPLWKTYCMARNSVFYYKKYFGSASVIKRIARLYIECILADSRKGQLFRETTRGILDGYKANFNKKLDLSR